MLLRPARNYLSSIASQSTQSPVVETQKEDESNNEPLGTEVEIPTADSPATISLEPTTTIIDVSDIEAIFCAMLDQVEGRDKGEWNNKIHKNAERVVVQDPHRMQHPVPDNTLLPR